MADRTDGVTIDKAWTINEKGVCLELGVRLNPHASKIVQLNTDEGKAWRKNLLDAHERTLSAKKNIQAEMERHSVAMKRHEAIRLSLGLSHPKRKGPCCRKARETQLKPDPSVSTTDVGQEIVSSLVLSPQTLPLTFLT